MRLRLPSQRSDKPHAEVAEHGLTRGTANPVPPVGTWVQIPASANPFLSFRKRKKGVSCSKIKKIFGTQKHESVSRVPKERKIILCHRASAKMAPLSSANSDNPSLSATFFLSFGKKEKTLTKKERNFFLFAVSISLSYYEF